MLRCISTTNHFTAVFLNFGRKTIFLDHFLQFSTNKAYMTILLLVKPNVVFCGYEKLYTFFDKIGLETDETLIVKVVKTWLK